MMVVYRKGWVKIQQMYENLEFDLDLKLLFMVTEAYYESGLLSLARFLHKQASIRNKNSINKQKCYLVVCCFHSVSVYSSQMETSSRQTVTLTTDFL